LELFIALDAPEDFLDFKVAYASGLLGTSGLLSNLSDQKRGMEAILDLIINEIPSPRVNPSGHLQFQPSLLDYNDFVGRIGIGLVKSGVIALGQNVILSRLDGSQKASKIMKIFRFVGINKFELERATAGDIVGVAALAISTSGKPFAKPGIEPLPPLP
jgi:GTP-binding protein